MERGSHNYEEQLHKIRLLHEHIANQRKDYLHKESRRIANAYHAVCVSDLDLRAVSRQMGNAMEAGFGEFRVQLTYKLERQGKSLIAVKPVPTTGTKRNRAINAAIQIKNFGLAQYYKASPLGRGGAAKP